jgi:quercetin dioxygenase-like cupin family protein
VIEGDVQVGPSERPVALAAGDFARFPADSPHVLRALSATATVHVVTTFPQIAQLPPVPQT